jgi:hypothetical protein
MNRQTENLSVGTPTVVESKAPIGPFCITFEDDGETGYVYALDFTQEQPIQEALLVYAVPSVADRHLLSQLSIAWTNDGSKAALFINSHPHALIDFRAKRAHCRSNFPTPSCWPIRDFSWSEEAMANFEREQTS